jgi:hypothetical protein
LGIGDFVFFDRHFGIGAIWPTWMRWSDLFHTCLSGRERLRLLLNSRQTWSLRKEMLDRLSCHR